MSKPKRSLIAAALFFSPLTLSTPASAEVVHHSPYDYEQTFGTALRLLKVDLDLKVTEPNSKWGYLLFEYISPESGDRKNRAAFEFVKNNDHIRVTLKLPQMPSYHERVMLKKLVRKLSKEHGAPPKREPKAKEPSKKPEGAGKPADTTG